MRAGPFLAKDSGIGYGQKIMRIAHALPVLAFIALASCRGSGGESGDVDTALLHRAGGDVMLTGGGRLAYEITSERYRQWETARRALRAARIGLSMQIDPLRVSESDIQRAVTFFERNRRARGLIEDTGMSVRDYVLTTIALEQQMAVASGRWGEREAPRAATRPVVPSESIAAELARDTARDTARRPRADTVPVVDTVVIPVDTPPSPPPPPDTTASATPSPQL
jgi:hypothetical protein